MKKIIRKIFLLPVRFYQIFLSPLMGKNCRFEPTCSNYMLQAVEEWGVIKGGWMGIKRIFRCHPWGGHGYDPVPKRKERGKPT